MEEKQYIVVQQNKSIDFQKYKIIKHRELKYEIAQDVRIFELDCSKLKEVKIEITIIPS